MRRLILICLALAVVGCSAYKPRSGNGPGYTDMQINANIYRVTLRGTAATKPDQADEMALLRASELMLSKGFPFFSVLSGSERIEHDSVTTPMQSTTLGTISSYGSSAKYSGQTSYIGGDTLDFETPTVTKTVIGFKDRPNSERLVYNSQQIFDSLASRYMK